MQPIVEVKNLSKHYKNIRAVDKLSFTVNEGDVPPTTSIVIDAILFAGVTVITGQLFIVPDTTPIRTISPAALPGKLTVCTVVPTFQFPGVFQAVELVPIQS